jgi:hypothetical protein
MPGPGERAVADPEGVEAMVVMDWKDGKIVGLDELNELACGLRAACWLRRFMR